MSDPDFDALRAERNADVMKHINELAEELGFPADQMSTTFDPKACYCACGTGGPCEHKWDGPTWESEDGCAYSVTCSRCGMTAMGHDMRCAP